MASANNFRHTLHPRDISHKGWRRGVPNVMGELHPRPKVSVMGGSGGRSNADSAISNTMRHDRRMSLSLCICTMNRPDDLRRALESIRDGSTQPHEVIVSDDGRSEETELLAAEFGAVYVEGPQRGLSANRNACLRTVTGTHVAFIDDDVTVPPEFVRVCETVASNHVVTGWEENYASGEPIRVESKNGSYLGFQEIPVTNKRVSICINATVFPARLFEIAQFNEHSKYGYEEIDIARQAVKKIGFPIDFDDRLWVRHFPSPVNRDKYIAVQNASRLFLTERAYRMYDERPGYALRYLIIASAHHIAATAKGRGDMRIAVKSIRDAWTWRKGDLTDRPFYEANRA